MGNREKDVPRKCTMHCMQKTFADNMSVLIKWNFYSQYTLKISNKRVSKTPFVSLRKQSRCFKEFLCYFFKNPR